MNFMEITNPVLMFAFIMSIILLAPVIFQKIRMPGIVGLIVAGIIIGPHALGILRSEESLRLFSSVGLIYLMFLAGLEINLSEFNRYKKYSITFGLLTFSLPMIIGTLGARNLFSMSWPSALLLASMFASHTLIPYPIVSRLGINKERSVIAAVGGTILTDTAALLVLAVIAEMTKRNLTAFFWFRQFVFLVLLVLFALWVLPRIAYSFFKILSPDGSSEFLLTLVLVFFTSYLAHLAGVEPIIGAFFAGLSLSRLIPEQSPLKNRLEFVGNTLFIPFFLISVGMLVNLQSMFLDRAVWAVALFMVITVIFCKYAASFIFTKLLKFTWDEHHLIFGLSINQAAATLAAVMIGLRLGIFNEQVLNGTIFMILVTCLIGPWFTEKAGKNIASHGKISDSSSIGIDERIMVAVSRDESAELLTDVALSLRNKDSAEALFPLYVVQDGMHVDKSMLSGEKMLSKVVARIVSADVPVVPVSRIDVSVPGGILRAVKEYHAGALVLGSSLLKESNLRTMLFDVSDKVCEESQQLIFLCQMSRSINMGENVFVLIPPMLECQKGFGSALESINNLAVINKIKIKIIGLSETVSQAEKFMFKKSASDLIFIDLKQWKNISEKIKENDLKESDSIILMAARKGQIGWRPALKRLFKELKTEFPENNIMMVYPSAAFEEMEFKVKREEKDSLNSSLLTRAPVEINKDSMEQAVSQLLQSYFSPSSMIYDEIMKNFYPFDFIELFPGILLLHTHSENLFAEPVILLGLMPKSIVFSSLNKKAHAIFILVSPKGQTNAHLQALTKVARKAREMTGEKEEDALLAE